MVGKIVFKDGSKNASKESYLDHKKLVKSIFVNCQLFINSSLLRMKNSNLLKSSIIDEKYDEYLRQFANHNYSQQPVNLVANKT